MVHFVSLSFSLTFTLKKQEPLCRKSFTDSSLYKLYSHIRIVSLTVSLPAQNSSEFKTEGESKVCIFTNWSTCSLDHHQNLIYQFLSQDKCALQLSAMFVCFWDILLTDRLRLENWTWLRLQWRTFTHKISNNVLEGCLLQQLVLLHVSSKRTFFLTPAQSEMKLGSFSDTSGRFSSLVSWFINCLQSKPLKLWLRDNNLLYGNVNVSIVSHLPFTNAIWPGFARR